MAGFVAPMAQWEYLEPKFDEVLSAYDVPVLHAKEFHDTKGPFTKWSRVKKRSFAEELFSFTDGRMYGLSMTVRKNDFVQAQKKTGRFATMSSIGVCFASLMVRPLLDPLIAPLAKEMGVSFLIESGNKNNAEIKRYFHKMSKAETFEGLLRSISFIDKTSCRAIQVADFLAFHSRRYMRNHDRFSGKVALPTCAFLDIIENHVKLWQFGGFGTPQVTTGSVDKNVPNLDALRALQKKPFG